MRARHKPLSEQVMVITGASSGIGLVTAFMAAGRGASVALASRNESDLDEVSECIQRKGGRAIWVKADVADQDQVERVADETVRAFGRIDTWVNNAAVSMYGRLLDLDPADMRRQMDVNFWGVVHGSLTAARRMQDSGGVIINNASVLADRAVPHQGIYCASKHAVRAFTDTLRMELELDRIPVAVSLIKPGSVDTPFFEKARTYFQEEPQPIPPVYAPEVVAEVILACAERPFREMTAGAVSGMLSLGQKVSPRLTDRYLERFGVDSQRSGQPLAPGRADNLYEPLPHDGGERGHNWQGRVLARSLVTESRLHPRRTGLTVAGVGLALMLGRRLFNGRRHVPREE
jgi:NAD(P)-dependent dehydrogenase (short-subunit alcohol dehydrogenase family)